MEVLTRVRAAGRQIDFGVATTEAERAAAVAQRFRVYQRHGYYRPGVTADRDEYDDHAVFFLATLSGGATTDALLGSARFVAGEADPRFRFPIQHVFELEPPEALRAIPADLCGEVSRMVAECPEGIGVGGLLTPLGLIQAVSQHSQRQSLRSGLALIKRRFLRAFASAGVRLHEITGGRVIYPADGPASPYFYQHRDPVVPVYWLIDEIAPEAERAVARYVDWRSSAQDAPCESTRNDNESATAVRGDGRSAKIPRIARNRPRREADPLTPAKRERYQGVTRRRRRGHAENVSKTVQTEGSSERLSPAKRRIAEALAALLVAHYRHQHAAPDPERERPPIA
jgi:hypothetical protein